jgi:hypothetical protein
MAKYHKLTSLICSVLFIVVVQLFAAPTPRFRFLIPAFFLYLGIVGLYNYAYLKFFNQYTIWNWLRMILFLIAWFALFLIIPTNALRGLFFIVGLGLIYFFERMLGNVGEQVLFNEILVSAFAFCMALFGFHWYFQFSSLVSLLLVFTSLTLVIRSSFASIPASSYVQWVGSIALGLFMTEVFWALSFWPLHYSALALILFSIFYFCWAMQYYFLFNHVTPKKIQFHLLLSAVCIAIILLVTPWSIIK